VSESRENAIKRIRRQANVLRKDVVQMIGIGKAGHLGGSCSLAEIVATLYFEKLRFDPKNPKDPDRDRFILSKGHAVLIQYAALAELGLIPREELSRLKTIGGLLQGHPDMEKTKGIEAVTGSLGQGLSIALGMALGLRIDRKECRIYVVIGDGELAEGQVWEAAMAIPAYGIENITAIIDRNKIQATGPTSEIMPIPDIEAKWRSFGWNVATVDGHDVGALLEAFENGAAKGGCPRLIVANTVKGKGIPFAENTAAFHNGAMTKEQYETALAELDRADGAIGGPSGAEAGRGKS